MVTIVIGNGNNFVAFRGLICQFLELFVLIYVQKIFSNVIFTLDKTKSK